MVYSIVDFFQDKKAAIIAEWVNCVKTKISDMYAGRPTEEINATVSEAYDAFMKVLFDDDFSHINQFIEKITKMRLEAGFLLSDVQMAFELFRSISIPLLAKETTVEEFGDTIIKMNRCMTHTIHRFSDLFQSMQQAKILEHNQRLEEQVRDRTAELKESELKYKILVEEINDGYFVIQDEVIVFANSSFGQMHGYKPSEMIGQKFYNFVEPSCRERVIGKYYKSLKTKKPLRMFEYLRMTRDGESYPTEIFSKVTNYDNKLSSIGICRDITVRVEMEQKVRESERMAYIGQIATSLSHEIRNPLSAIQMNLQILRKNQRLKGNDQKRIDISVREVGRLENILKELLDFAKPVRLSLKKESLNQILLSSIELLEMKIKAEGLILTTNLDPSIPTIQVDKQKLKQAFINLLLNAVQASTAGHKIHVQSQYKDKNGGQAVVAVSDEGTGVPENILPDIFKPFFTTKGRGTGLGLNNVKRIAEAHKGWIEVQNLVPSGASFKLHIPAQ